MCVCVCVCVCVCCSIHRSAEVVVCDETLSGWRRMQSSPRSERVELCDREQDQDHKGTPGNPFHTPQNTLHKGTPRNPFHTPQNTLHKGTPRNPLLVNLVNQFSDAKSVYYVKKCFLEAQNGIHYFMYIIYKSLSKLFFSSLEPTVNLWMHIKFVKMFCSLAEMKTFAKISADSDQLW